MDQRPTSMPEFDWRSEQSAQKRDQARFGTELERVLSVRGATPGLRQAAARLRERWDHLLRRVEGRWARGSDAWDHQVEQMERLRNDRAILEALAEYDEQRHTGDLEHLLHVTLRAIVRSIPRDGAMVVLTDVGGQMRQAATERRRGQWWPRAADRELAQQLAAGAREGRRIVIEGRPVKGGPRESGRITHWLAVPAVHGADSYGAVVVGRTSAEEPFNEDNREVLARIGRRLGASLAARVGVGARPSLGAGQKTEGFEHLWGEAAALRQAVALAARFALADCPVTIEGEMGTGRETIARAIHRRSARASGPFIVFRGAGLAGDDVARGFFGVTQMNADGKAVENPGDVELAKEGTLFIDDLAVFDMPLQGRLLRLLEEGTFERVGDRTPRQANVRLICASTGDLASAVSREELRSDLYYQITAARLALPPLRERGSDVVELARRFAIAAGQRAGKRIEGIDAEAARLLAAAPFPGNVRQLAQVIERAVFLAAGPLVTALDLPREIASRAVAPSLDSAGWVEQAGRAVRQAADAGQAGDWRQFHRARKLAELALAGAFAGAVMKAVGRHASRAARHCGIHRAQWWRLWRQVQGPPARDGVDSSRVRQEVNHQ